MIWECQQLNFGIQLLLNSYISIMLKHFQEKNMKNKNNELMPSWQANSHSSSQEIPAFFGTPRLVIIFTEVHH
jgi:hypothetical protein